MSTEFKKLLEPCHIGRIQTRNRIVKTAAQTYFFDSGEQRISARALAFYEALARGGVGLIVVETPAMEYPLSETGDRRFRLDDDKYIQDVSRLTEVIHRYGCPAFVQFYHRGPWGGVYALMAPPVAASAVTIKSEFDVHEDQPPRALTIPEIKELVDRYASMAVRAAKAGFDGVEVHSGSDHLLPTFLSRFWNKRQDEYGAQNMQNRTRFVVEIITEIKRRLGKDFPLQVLINGVEVGGGEEGMTIAESKEIAGILEAAGADSLQVRAHWFGQHQGSSHNDLIFYPEPPVPFKDLPKELDWSLKGLLTNVPVTAAVKKVVSIPIMTVGGFDARLGEMVLRQGKADLIGMTRRLFADPEYVNKVSSGRLDEIAPCTHCGNCMKVYNEPRQCRVNAAFGTEDYVIEKAETKKKVLIAGGGPAGMEAARVAALRGHQVTLYEKKSQLGGSLPIAAMVKGMEIEDLPAIVRYLKHEITRLGVKIKRGQELTGREAAEIKPDVLIVACGGISTLPDIPGIDKGIVISSASLYNTLNILLEMFGPRLLRWLSKIWMPLGRSIVIIGSGIQGFQLAELLVKRGRKVTIVDTAAEPGEGLAPERKTRLLAWFRKKGVDIYSGAKLEEITDKGLAILTAEGNKQFMEADNIIPALPLLPDTELVKRFEGTAAEVYSIGDCTQPGLIPDATAAGWQTGRKI